MSYKFSPRDNYADYHTGSGILEWRQGIGFIHGRWNPVVRRFKNHQSRTGWIRKIKNKCEEGWSLLYEESGTDSLEINAWIEEDF